MDTIATGPPPAAPASDWQARQDARLERARALARPRSGRAEVATRPDAAPERAVDSPIAAAGGQIDGDRVLRQIYGYLGHMAAWPNQAAQFTAVLYAAAAQARAETAIDGGKYMLPVWTYMPRLFFTSAEGGSGKSWMARLTASMCPHPERLAEMTKASLVDIIAEQHTPVITELDTFVATGGRNRWLTGIANVGYEFDGKTSRKHGGKVNRIPLFGPMILDGLDTVITATGMELRTLMSRCIIVRVERAPAGYRPPAYKREVIAQAKALNGRLARWMAAEVDNGIGDLEPDVPSHLGNRPFDLWAPLFAVAERAGGQWPVFARYACEHMETPALPDGREDAEADALDEFLADVGAPVPSLPEAGESWGGPAEFTPPPAAQYQGMWAMQCGPGEQPETETFGPYASRQDAQDACQDTQEQVEAQAGYGPWEPLTWQHRPTGDDQDAHMAVSHPEGHQYPEITYAVTCTAEE